jgi:hypothetical protein
MCDRPDMAVSGIVACMAMFAVIFVLECVVDLGYVMDITRYIKVYVSRAVLRFTFLAVWVYDLTHDELGMWLAVAKAPEWTALLFSVVVLNVCDVSRALMSAWRAPRVLVATWAVISFLWTLSVMIVLIVSERDVEYSTTEARSQWSGAITGSFACLALDTTIACFADWNRRTASVAIVAAPNNRVVIPANRTVHEQFVRLLHEMHRGCMQNTATVVPMPDVVPVASAV